MVMCENSLSVSSTSLCPSLLLRLFYDYISVALFVTAIQTQEKKNPLNVQPYS